MLRLALIYAAILIAYDALAAAVARSITISYDSFLVLSLVIVFFMGVYAGRKKQWRGVVVVAIAAALEATLGWYVAALIGPGYVPGWTMQTLVVMALEGALLATVIGAAGVWIGLGVAGARRGLF